MKSSAEVQSALVWTITELHSQSVHNVPMKLQLHDKGLPILSVQQFPCLLDRKIPLNYGHYRPKILQQHTGFPVEK